MDRPQSPPVEDGILVRMRRPDGRKFLLRVPGEHLQRVMDDGQLVALYLMTCSHNTIAGAFRLPDGYILEDTGWNAERVSKGFPGTVRNGFAERCPVTKWVWICKHLEWNPPENPNQWKAVAKICKTIPANCSWRSRFRTVETVSKGLNNSPVPVPVPVQGVQGEKKPRKKSRRNNPSRRTSRFRSRAEVGCRSRGWPASSSYTSRRSYPPAKRRATPTSIGTRRS
jgi:hypothetical protein